MGLTIHYDWKTKADVASARRLIARFRAMAQKLPFDKISEIFEQDPPDGEWAFRKYDHSFREGTLFLPRKRSDGLEETVIGCCARCGSGTPSSQALSVPSATSSATR